MKKYTHDFRLIIYVFRKLSMISLVFLSACRSEQLIPMITATNSELAQPITRQDLSVSSPTIPSSPSVTPELIRSTSTPEQTPHADITITEDCIQVSFISDVTVPDGTRMESEQIFLKIWRLKNSGECQWPEDLFLVFAGGVPLGGTMEIPVKFYPEGAPLTDSMGERAWAELILVDVHPGETIDLPIMFQAPGITGDYFGLWALRSPLSDEDLLQIYVEIGVEGPDTPEPTIWGGEWAQLNLHTGSGPSALVLEQRELQVRGYFYAPNGELYLLEGGLFDHGSRIEGTFGPPYHDGFPFEWQLMENNRSFQGIYQDRLVSAGAWCGARDEGSLPVPCELEP
jgi:hypothetical protein